MNPKKPIPRPTSVTITDIARAAQKHFRAYGFAATNPTIEAVRSSNRKMTGTIRVVWAKEYAIGMAAFSQMTVTPALEVYVPVPDGVNQEVEPDPWALWATQVEMTDPDLPESADSIVLNLPRLKVDYEHHDRGSNGVSRDFFVRYDGKTGELVLVARRQS